MVNPGIGQGSEALQAPYVQAYIQSGNEAGAYGVSVGGKLRLAVQATGAVLSVAVLCAGGWWGYKQIMRDVHGVPVIKALEGPMRVAPDNPGGMVASHAGFAVNAVQAVGTAATPESELILAPDPVALAEEDLPTSELTPAVAESGNEAAAGADADVLEIAGRAEADDADLVDPTPQAPTPASLSQDVPEDDPMTRALALADVAARGADPLMPAPETPSASAQESAIEAAVRTAAVTVPPGVLGDDGSVVASPRPAPRPGRRAGATLASADATAPAPPKVTAPEVISAGTRLVQLGAFDTAEEAEAAWGSISVQFRGLMADKTRVIVEAQSGGREFWRLRAMGFADLDEARRFCAALIAEHAECIPVVAR
ncbi:SPOR domain-containing protein [Tropicimonas marinistellae]|uniref:SPOR domain-containing protein n=1 Tax=Tropicimonas marinistellae TaxID=1739787 RepID=UPI00083336E7|nr:SPOR domain-containing protein [Tropicimonas marinistellae]